jgi:YVTN family beta-propeller protein
MGISACYDVFVSDTVSVIDGKTNNVVENVTVGKHPSGVAVDPNTNMAYVSNSGSNTVSVIDGKTNNVVESLSSGRTPRGLVVHPGTNTVYVANRGSNTVSIIDVSEYKIYSGW